MPITWRGGTQGQRVAGSAGSVIGEIGGDAEERAADYIAAHITKPVVGYVVMRKIITDQR